MQNSLFDQIPVAGAAYRIGIPHHATAKQRQNWNLGALTIVERLTNERRGPTLTEQENLAKYSGLGGIGESLNEFYTPEELAQLLWRVVGQLKVAQTMLEPSAGVGVFLQDAPVGVICTAIELDPTSSAINRHLLPNVTSHQSSFERWHNEHSEQRFDLVMGNPPFGVRMEDSIFDKPEILEASRYFLTRALSHLNDHGILAMVLPSGIAANKSDVRFREGILCQAQVLGVFGLPNSTFARAGCDVATTDVWFLRKRSTDLSMALDLLSAAYGIEQALALFGLENETFLSGRILLENHNRVFGNIQKHPFMGGTIDVRIGDFFAALKGIAVETAQWNSSTGLFDISLAKIMTTLNEQGLTGVAKKLHRRLESEIEAGTIRWDGSLLEVYNNGWQTQTQELTEAFADAERLEVVMTTYHRNQFAGEVEKNLMSEQIAKLLGQFLAKHGNPQALFASMLPSIFRNVKAGIVDGAVAAEYAHVDNQCLKGFDFHNIAEVIHWLRIQGIPTSLANIEKHFIAPVIPMPQVLQHRNILKFVA
jgi:hypothetical protein